MTPCNEPGCVDGWLTTISGAEKLCPCSPAKAAVEAVCEALRPCPFCEGPAKLVGVGAWNKCSAAYCDNCEIYGPMMATKETAAYAWNRRPSPAPQSVEAVGEERAIRSYYFTVAAKGFQATAPLWNELADETKRLYRDFSTSKKERRQDEC